MAAVVLSAPTCVLADTDRVTDQTVWSSWDLSASIVIPTGLALAIYAMGLIRRPGAFDAHPWRSMAYIWGVLTAFLSLSSPIDALSDHLFFMHQVQHMLLRVIAPMLVALSQPQAELIAGLPPWLRRGGLAPVAGAGAVRATFGFLTRPVVATALFVGSLYVWQWPPLHDLAILNEGVHYVMHTTMLAAGLLFFWRVFDKRPAPKGTPFGARLMMLWIAVLANIPIGAYTTFKGRVLYPAYDVVGRLFHIAPISDERLGGFIMWAPGSMMMLVAVLVVIHDWAGFEDKMDDRRLARIARGLASAAPATASALIERQQPKNRALAWGLAGFVLCMLAATLAIGVLAVHPRPPAPGEMAGAGPAITGDSSRAVAAIGLSPPTTDSGPREPGPLAAHAR
ncbi:MAG: cytochrome c oxidase assembly protein [Caulobacteraceae bacterium]